MYNRCHGQEVKSEGKEEIPKDKASLKDGHAGESGKGVRRKSVERIGADVPGLKEKQVEGIVEKLGQEEISNAIEHCEMIKQPIRKRSDAVVVKVPVLEKQA